MQFWPVYARKSKHHKRHKEAKCSMISKHYETLFWRAEKSRNYVDAYQPVLLFKSSCWKKQIRKLVYSTKEWRFQAHDTSVGNKKIIYVSPIMIFSQMVSQYVISSQSLLQIIDYVLATCTTIDCEIVNQSRPKQSLHRDR